MKTLSVFISGLLTFCQLTFVQQVYSQSSLSEREAVKRSAVSFFSWYEKVWDTGDTVRIRESFKILRNKSGQPETEDGYGCPCKLDKRETNAYFEFVGRIAEPISRQYLFSAKAELNNLAVDFSKAKTSEQNLRLVESFYDKLFKIFPGNGGEPKFSDTGLLDSSSKWNFSFKGKDKVLVNITIKMPRGWSEKFRSYHLSMIKENGKWKLAGPVSEGNSDADK